MAANPGLARGVSRVAATVPGEAMKTLLVRKQLYVGKVKAYANMLGPRQRTADSVVNRWKKYHVRRMEAKTPPTLDELLERLPFVVELDKHRGDQARLGKLAAAVVGHRLWRADDITKVIDVLGLDALQQYALWTRAARNAFAPGPQDKPTPRMSDADASAALDTVQRAEVAFGDAMKASTTESLPSPAGVLDVLVANPAIPNRHEHINRVLDACKVMMPKWSNALSEFYRSRSHAHAVARLPEGPLKKTLGSPRAGEKSIGRLSKESWRLFGWSFPKQWVMPLNLARQHLDQIRGAHYRAAGFAAYLEQQKDHLRLALSPASRALYTTPESEAEYEHEVRRAAFRLAEDVKQLISEEGKLAPVNVLYRLLGLYSMSGTTPEVARIRRLIARRKVQEEKELEEKRKVWAESKAERKAEKEAAEEEAAERMKALLETRNKVKGGKGKAKVKA